MEGLEFVPGHRRPVIAGGIITWNPVEGERVKRFMDLGSRGR